MKLEISRKDVENSQEKTVKRLLSVDIYVQLKLKSSWLQQLSESSWCKQLSKSSSYKQLNNSAHPDTVFSFDVFIVTVRNVCLRAGYENYVLRNIRRKHQEYLLQYSIDGVDLLLPPSPNLYINQIYIRKLGKIRGFYMYMENQGKLGKICIWKTRENINPFYTIEFWLLHLLESVCRRLMKRLLITILRLR